MTASCLRFDVKLTRRDPIDSRKKMWTVDLLGGAYADRSMPVCTCVYAERVRFECTLMHAGMNIHHLDVLNIELICGAKLIIKEINWLCPCKASTRKKPWCKVFTLENCWYFF